MAIATIAQAAPRASSAAGIARVMLLASCFSMLTVAVYLRMWKLDTLPGINGDEAWYGVQALQMIHGGELQWRTPTGNLINPFYMLPLLLAHYCWQPSFGLLRAVAVVSGLAALVLNFFLCRKVYDQATAVWSTLILAVLPINIAYGRFGWDASQSLAATLLVVYCSLLAIRNQRHRVLWLVLGLLALAAAWLVHPTNIFAAPWWAVAFITCFHESARRSWNRIPSTALKRGMMMLALAVALLAGWIMKSWLAVAVAQVQRPGDLIQFAELFPRMFSGITVFQYVSGAVPTTIPCGHLLDIAGWLAGLLLLVSFCRLWQRGERLDRAALMAWLLMMLAFFLIAGPRGVAPHWERYGIVLIGPTVLLAARGMRSLVDEQSRAGTLITALCCVYGWLLLAGCYSHYFRHIQQTGGTAHRTFRSASEEPKAAALQAVLLGKKPGATTWVLASEWWNYWPLAYLAFNHSQLHVVQPATAWSDPAFIAAVKSGDAWSVEFHGNHSNSTTRWQLRHVANRGYREQIISDYAGRAQLSVWQPLLNGPVERDE